MFENCTVLVIKKIYISLTDVCRCFITPKAKAVKNERKDFIIYHQYYSCCTTYFRLSSDKIRLMNLTKSFEIQKKTERIIFDIA